MDQKIPDNLRCSFISPLITSILFVVPAKQFVQHVATSLRVSYCFLSNRA
ncbi:MAG: hypothetical protein AB7F96_22270 [Beijerinckiaceae bacterium]